MPHFDESNFWPENSPGYLLRVAQQLCLAALDRAVAEDGLTAVQWMVLVKIHFGMAATCADLARALAHDKGAMTRIVDQMEANGWVTRERDRDDRRLVRLALTKAGTAVAMAARRKVIACWNGFLADWSAADVALLIAMLQRLRVSMEEADRCAA